jgi:mannose-6-phosphate isomerase-like protein (cupin superfamily)
MPVTKYRFEGRSGYLVAPETAAHGLLAFGHSFATRPWSDPAPHLHTAAEEFYFVLQGELWLAVAGERLTMRPREIVMVRPGVPHLVLGGVAPIEHFGLRAPTAPDKQPAEAAPPIDPGDGEPRDLRRAWGCRVALGSSQHHNCWLFGAGSAQFEARHLALAYLNFPTPEAANAGLGTRHRLHYHERSWEYYVVLCGRKTLQIDNELVDIEPGEVLEVPPRVNHTLHSRQAPFEGFTLRVPLELHDKVEL